MTRLVLRLNGPSATPDRALEESIFLQRRHHALASPWHLAFDPKKKPWLPPSPF